MNCYDRFSKLVFLCFLPFREGNYKCVCSLCLDEFENVASNPIRRMSCHSGGSRRLTKSSLGCRSGRIPRQLILTIRNPWGRLQGTHNYHSFNMPRYIHTASNRTVNIKVFRPKNCRFDQSQERDRHIR